MRAILISIFTALATLPGCGDTSFPDWAKPACQMEDYSWRNPPPAIARAGTKPEWVIVYCENGNKEWHNEGAGLVAVITSQGVWNFAIDH